MDVISAHRPAIFAFCTATLMFASFGFAQHRFWFLILHQGERKVVGIIIGRT